MRNAADRNVGGMKTKSAHPMVGTAHAMASPPHRSAASLAGRGLAAASLVGALALAGCSDGSTVEEAAPAPVPDWEPMMTVPGTQPLPGETVDALQQALEEWLAETGYVGATAAVVSADGVWQGASGVDGVGTDLEPTSAMAMLAISKTYTGAAVMSLVDAGSVDLDAPLDTYVSLPFQTDNATVRQLLNMRSGYPHDEQQTHIRAEELSEDLQRSWSITEVLDWHAGAIGSQGEQGGEQVYKELNFMALGALVEEVAGMPMAEVVRSEFLDPATLEQTWYQDAEEPQAPLTVAVENFRLDTIDQDGPWLPSRSWASADGPARGMAASAGDIARWGYLLYGGFLLQPASVEEMTRLQQPSDVYGLATGLASSADSVGHAGYPWDYDVYQSHLEVWPSDEVSIAVLVPEQSGSSKDSRWNFYHQAGPTQLEEFADLLRSAAAGQ